MTAGLIGKRAYCKRYCPLAPVPRPACLPIVDSASASCSSLRVFTQAPWQFQFSKMKCPSLISRRHLPATRRFSCRHAGYLCPASRGETSAVPLKSSPVGLRRAATLMLDAAAPVIDAMQFQFVPDGQPVDQIAGAGALIRAHFEHAPRRHAR